MDWKPIAEDEIKSLFAEALAALSPPQQARYGAYLVVPRKAIITRGKTSAPDPVWVLAEGNEKLIFYDDVEDEFSVVAASSAPGGPGAATRLFTDLGSALAEMLR